MPDLLAGSIIRAIDTPPATGAVSGDDEAGFTTTSYTQGTTVVGAAFVAPTSGRVLVLWHARFEHNTASSRSVVSVSVRTGATVGAGTVVSGAADDSALECPQGAGGPDTRISAGMWRIVSGLTPGDDYNAVVEHHAYAGNGDIFARSVAVVPLT